MSNKRNKNREATGKSAAEYYKLKTKAVDDLVTANKENSQDISEAELRKYRSGTRKFKLADWVKVLLVKFWFPAAVCYFMIWGLGTYVSNLVDMLFITGIAMGLVTDLLTNNLIRFFEERSGEYDHWLMFAKRRYITIFLNILYSWLLIYLVACTYTTVNSVIVTLWQLPDGTVPLGVEPILFGLFYLGYDSLMIGAKRLLFKIVADAKERVKNS